MNRADVPESPVEDPANRPPEGYRRHGRSSPFVDLVGPLYSRGEGMNLRLALRVDSRHLNGTGTVHGGVLATLADLAIGYAVASSTDPPTPLTTSSLTVYLSGMARPGDLVTTSSNLQHRGSRVMLAHCTLAVGTRTIAQASAVFVPGRTAPSP
ncbi:PaaI family thioesterase [Pseudonocardia spinosispora]|uniref:PaaI family thioesterase n=1 Tax=Pseudonocardia spinosispora TaxID=103441 RepID=UPI0004064E3F|nr:PaaI family thioesterase [Pseudonocardia spinosispora]